MLWSLGKIRDLDGRIGFSFLLKHPPLLYDGYTGQRCACGKINLSKRWTQEGGKRFFRALCEQHYLSSCRSSVQCSKSPPAEEQHLNHRPISRAELSLVSLLWAIHLSLANQSAFCSAHCSKVQIPAWMVHSAVCCALCSPLCIL